MTLPIPAELQKAIDASAGEPVRFVDPDTNSTYVLVVLRGIGSLPTSMPAQVDDCLKASLELK